MKIKSITLLLASAMFIFSSCGSDGTSDASGSDFKHVAGQSAVQDDESQLNVVQVAVSSKDHTTLVEAVKAAGLVDALTNAGPFTVFAPVNAAFDVLPAGTVQNLLKPENNSTLNDILQYHVSVGIYRLDDLYDGRQIGQVNGGRVTISEIDGIIKVNDAAIIATVPSSNGIIHVIDGVLLPPSNN